MPLFTRKPSLYCARHTFGQVLYKKNPQPQKPLEDEVIVPENTRHTMDMVYASELAKEDIINLDMPDSDIGLLLAS